MGMMSLNALKRFSWLNELAAQKEIAKSAPDQIVYRDGAAVVMDPRGSRIGCEPATAEERPGAAVPDRGMIPDQDAGEDVECLISSYFEIPEVKKAISEAEEAEEKAAVRCDSTAGSPIIRLVDAIILKAVRDKASDIHIEPFKDHVQVRFRIDGVLQRRLELPYRLIFPLVSRVKVMADLDITERRLPQDGRIQLESINYDLDLRVSTVPTIFGEKIVIRIFDKGGIHDYTLQNLGFSPRNYKLMRDFLRSPSGLVLAVGPTGSGKSTTLIAALKYISSAEKNIVTVEDPVEYVLEGVNHTQINSKAGASFATYLRAILRQDPDVIMIGEIRDLETAEIAVRAATTGHLVLSTMHTNDAPGALTRLVDMGVEPFMVASAVLGVVSQRLVRRVCSNCREKRMSSEAEMRLAGVADRRLKISSAQGCGECGQTGYRGRGAIHEILKISDNLQKQILQLAPVSELRRTALQDGMIPIREDGMGKALQGVTTMREVMRVLGEE